MDEQNKDLGTQGKEDTLKGKINQTVGKAQAGLGHAVGNEDMEAKGKAKQVSGTIQSTAGHVEQKVDNALNPNNPNNTSNP